MFFIICSSLTLAMFLCTEGVFKISLLILFILSSGDGFLGVFKIFVLSNIFRSDMYIYILVLFLFLFIACFS